MRSVARGVTTNIRKLIEARPKNTGQTVYLTHVKWVTGKAQLEHYFKRYGPIQSVNMFYDPDTGLHRGFASITFDSKDSANKAIEQRPHVIDGDRVDVEPYIPLISKNKKKDLML
ncbi:hypothetical protein GCK72_018599 [Caenorhabditis remanei]|uniref:RRM domain-containing protein n=3 Tax=Caenorhabditis TaxID=6237 RepID=E3LPE0_CAERE|nr:hypothetical protein GCK72_018599 [Caenorhabditis remanei]EFP05355.1 hypothetical protein CRE_27271 [Caenorhabditis remanei]KAF1752045.1 hypothetical protein GCK72_018599 [Caenorhabditis remanei]